MKNNLQKHRPLAVRQKISQKLKNRSMPDSVKQKIAASMRKRWAELENTPNVDNNKNKNENPVVL